MAGVVIAVNRAPVLTLWTAVVAERLGHDWDAALTLGRVLAGLNAQAKGRSLGIFGPSAAADAGPDADAKPRGEDHWVELLGRAVPAQQTPDGERGVSGDTPVQPEAVRAYLAKAFGDQLDAVTQAMRALAGAMDPAVLATRAYALYEQFRPAIAPGRSGWGQKGELSLDAIAAAAR